MSYLIWTAAIGLMIWVALPLFVIGGLYWAYWFLFERCVVKEDVVLDDLIKGYDVVEEQRPKCTK